MSSGWPWRLKRRVLLGDWAIMSAIGLIAEGEAGEDPERVREGRAFAFFLRPLQRLVDLRRVVGVETDHAGDFRVGRQHVVDVAAGLGEIDVVAAYIDEFDALAVDGLPEARDTFLGVIGAEVVNYLALCLQFRRQDADLGRSRPDYRAGARRAGGAGC